MNYNLLWLSMNPVSNPLNKLGRDALVSAKMQTTQRLRFSQK